MGQKQDGIKRRTEPKKIALDVSTPKVTETPELADIDPRFTKYVQISKDYSMIEQFTCPVEGCNYRTDQGPGSLRMHMVIAADPNMKGRYCPLHQAFVNANPDDMTLDGIRYLAKFPSTLHLDTSLKHIKE